MDVLLSNLHHRIALHHSLSQFIQTLQFLLRSIHCKRLQVNRHPHPSGSSNYLDRCHIEPPKTLTAIPHITLLPTPNPHITPLSPPTHTSPSLPHHLLSHLTFLSHHPLCSCAARQQLQPSQVVPHPLAFFGVEAAAAVDGRGK